MASGEPSAPGPDTSLRRQSSRSLAFLCAPRERFCSGTLHAVVRLPLHASKEASCLAHAQFRPIHGAWEQQAVGRSGQTHPDSRRGSPRRSQPGSAREQPGVPHPAGGGATQRGRRHDGLPGGGACRGRRDAAAADRRLHHQARDVVLSAEHACIGSEPMLGKTKCQREPSSAAQP